MGYQIGNLGLGRQSGDHRAKAIEKDPDTGFEPVAYGLRVHCSTNWASLDSVSNAEFLVFIPGNFASIVMW